MSKQNFTAPGAPAPAIRPIETRYKGYRFRSRLEARWAVFFDALGLKWEYEPEGYELGGGVRYLPDFKLLDLHWWVEIKPLPRGFDGQPWIAGGTKEMAFLDARENESLAVEGDGYGFIVLYGTPGWVEAYDARSSYAGSVGWDSPYLLCECAHCGALGFQFDGRDGRNDHIGNCKALSDSGDRGSYNVNSPRILAAANKARAARFEHGECGA